MAYGYNTAWGNTDNIDRNIAQLKAQIASLGEGDFSQKGAIEKQIGTLENQKARQEWLGGMGQAATLANNVDPATLAGMLVGNLLGGALSRHLNRTPHSAAYGKDNTGRYDPKAWNSMKDVTQAAVSPAKVVNSGSNGFNFLEALEKYKDLPLAMGGGRNAVQYTW